MSDDQLGTVAVSLVVGELQWAPDVAPAVLDRISRDAVAYPEQFDRRAHIRAPQVPPPPSERSAKRTIGRLAVFGALIVIIVIIVGLVAFAATSAAADLEGHTPPALGYGRGDGCCSGTLWGADADQLVAGSATFVPIGAIDGRLVSFGVDQSGELYAVDQGGRILHVVTEAS